MWHDLVLATRFLRKNPVFTLAAALTLALGIGANATVFSFADTVLYRELPAPDADRIVHVFQQRADNDGRYPLSYADYVDYRASVRGFEQLAAHYPTSPMHVVFSGEPAALTGAVVTASYFEVLALKPSAGRFFTTEEDRVRDRDAVAVISYGLWHRHYAGEASALGATMTINGRPFSIIGVAPRDFDGVHQGAIRTDVWIPSAMFAVGYRYCDAFARECTIVDLLGRLSEGVTIAQAQREMDVVARQLAMAYPQSNEGNGVRIVPARGISRARAEEERLVSLYLGVVAVVLLIACANIAGLLLARAVGRRKEFAIRVALGARQARLVRQLLTEALLLAVVGGGVGLLCAFWGNAILDTLYSTDNAGRPLNFHLTLNMWVVAATAGITGTAAIAFGLLPALQASRPDVLTTLKADGPASGGRARLRQLLVTAQIALSVILLIAAGLLTQSMSHLNRGPGFDVGHVLLLRLRPSLIDYSFARAREYQRQVVSRLESTPGVLSASPASFLTIMGAGVNVRVARTVTDATPVQAVAGHVGPRYFETIGLPMLKGREFADDDRLGAPSVIVINDVLATKLWPDGTSVGRSVTLNNGEHLIVGVIRDAQFYATGEAPRPQLFYSYWQSGERDAFLKDSRMHVRVTGDPRAVLAQLRREVAGVDPSVPLSEDAALADRIAYNYQPVRIARAVVVSFAALALVLSAVGLYGVLAFAMQQRTREVGIRVALGAQRLQVAALALNDAVRMALGGVVVGIAGGWATSKWLASLLYGVDRIDPLTYLAAPLLILVVVALATIVPARRAMRVSPLTALRYE